jgi:hypothetical protein
MHLSLINLPRYEIHRPPLGLAILSALCHEQGVEHCCLDLSLLIWQKLPRDFEEIDNYCITGKISQQCLVRLENLIDQSVTDLVSRRPDTMFALSLLSMWSLPISELFCRSIRKNSQCEILLGGQGLASPEWVQKQLDQKLIDNFIVGEGEISFRRFLQGSRSGPGINNFDFEQIDDLDSHCVIPDYRSLPIDQYPYLTDRPDLFITASRGCVRRCGYCDIGHQWKKYRYRSADHVAQEMIAQYERHGIKDFFFTDSLINGSMKMLDQLCDRLIEYKKSNPEADFQWRGQYIFRQKSSVNETHIKKMVDAGVTFLIIGLETGSDRVRYDMNKKHTTEDAEWFLEMFKKYGIQCRLLMLTGWITETLEDHADTMALFSRWQKFVASRTITGIELGSTLTILDHSPVGIDSQQIGLQFLADRPNLWFNPNNPDLTIAERVRRRMELHKEAMHYHWPVTRSLYRLSTIRRNVEEAVELLQAGHRWLPKKKPITINWIKKEVSDLDTSKTDDLGARLKWSSDTTN